MLHLKKLNDTHLLEQFSEVVFSERKVTVQVISYLAEIYQRKLYAKEGFSSLFSFIKEKYHYSGSGAYRRIQAARLSCRYPRILNYLELGKLNLQALCLIEPYINDQNQEKLIDSVCGKTKEEIEYLLSQEFLTTPIKMAEKIRRLPVVQKVISVESPKDQTSAAAALPCPQIVQSQAEVEETPNSKLETKTIEVRRVKIEFVADEKVAKKIERAKEILRHKFPKGRLEEIMDLALEDLLNKRDPERKFQMKSPNKNEQKKISSKKATRYIPASIRKAVWRRDEGKCTYVGSNGKVCDERNAIQYDHIRPFSLGGDYTSENLRLLCRTHNQFRAEETFSTMPQDYR